MAVDDDMITVVANWMASQLYALTYNNVPVFKRKTAGKSENGTGLWRHQIAASKSGLESSQRFAPFAFVGAGDEDTAREGDRDLRRIPGLKIVIGTASKEDGVALWGDGTQLGINKIQQLVINLFDKKRPTDPAILCDEIYYINTFELADLPKVQWRQLNFEFSQMVTE